MAYIESINLNLTGTTFTDELHSNVGSSAFQIDHDYFWGGVNLAIRTAAGGGGTQLVEGAGNDYLLNEQNTDLTTDSGNDTYKKIQIINATYQTGNLYFSGKYIADDNDADDLNNVSETIISVSADTTIASGDSNNVYLVTTNGVLKIVTLPAVADSTNRIITVCNTDLAIGTVRIDTDSTDEINGLDNLFLWKQNDIVRLLCDGTKWIIWNDFKPYLESGIISNNDWTNRHLGFIEVDYDNLNLVFELGEIITEATSSNTAVVYKDTGSTLSLLMTTGTGLYTNNRVITGGHSGATADINEAGTGSTKDLDSSVYHGWGVNLDKVGVEIYYLDATDFTGISQEIKSLMPGSTGIVFMNISTDEFKIQTGSSGIVILSDSGGTSTLSADKHYKITIRLEL